MGLRQSSTSPAAMTTALGRCSRAMIVALVQLIEPFDQKQTPVTTMSTTNKAKPRFQRCAADV